MKHVTNTKDFVLFVKSCKEWLLKFGVTEWRIDYEHDDLPNNATRGWVNFSVTGRWAVIGLAKNWGDEDEVTIARIKETAFHEVQELILSRLAVSPFDRSVDEERITEEVHIVIRRWENFVKSIGVL